eukprot:3876515-Prymnesium_polylepis.1
MASCAPWGRTHGILPACMVPSSHCLAARIMSTRRPRSGPATGRPSAPAGENVGAPLPCDL